MIYVLRVAEEGYIGPNGLGTGGALGRGSLCGTHFTCSSTVGAACGRVGSASFDNGFDGKLLSIMLRLST